jgi:hypothetical protein
MYLRLGSGFTTKPYSGLTSRLTAGNEGVLEGREAVTDWDPGACPVPLTGTADAEAERSARVPEALLRMLLLPRRPATGRNRYASSSSSSEAG